MTQQLREYDEANPSFRQSITSNIAVTPVEDAMIHLPSLIVDKRLPILKPKLVEWTFDAWTQLNKRKEMLVKGWTKTGLTEIFKKKRQDEAIVNLFKVGIRLDEHEDGMEEDGESSADQEAERDEDEECDDENDENGVEEDEEEVDLDRILATTVVDEPPTGIRRSARLTQSLQMRQDHEIARAVQQVDFRGVGS